ncbi:MAG: cell division protein ZapA [Burkholderiaceae bacterium]|nr:cell division protein ZapA [Burkholderiaceae bacterium]
MKQIEATILGQSYVLGCPEGGESSLLAAVAAVDTEMSAIRDAGRVKARERIAVLAALNLAYKLAEQPLTAAAASAPATPAQVAQVAPAATEAGGVDLDALVARIDRLLQDDGLLL